MATSEGQAKEQSDDGDLYDDVEDVKLASSTNGAVKRQNSIGRKYYETHGMQGAGDRPMSLTEKVVELEAETKRLTEENKTLKRNMGTLYRTATAELARKDRQMEELRQQAFHGDRQEQRPSFPS